MYELINVYLSVVWSDHKLAECIRRSGGGRHDIRHASEAIHNLALVASRHHFSWQTN